MNRLVFALAPLLVAPLLGACSESGNDADEMNDAFSAGSGASTDATTGGMGGVPGGGGTTGGGTSTTDTTTGGTASVGTTGSVGGTASTGDTTSPDTSSTGPGSSTTSSSTDGAGGAGGGAVPDDTGSAGGSGGSMPDNTGSAGGSGGEMSDPDGGAGGDMGAGGSDGMVEEPTGSPTCPYTPPEDPATFPDGWTAAPTTQFNDNGGWTWYNDERVVVDAEAGKIVVSSAASNANNQNSTTNIDAVIHDLATGMNEKMSLGSLSYSDDHNNGGIVITAPGEYFVAWAHHNVDCNTYWRNYNGGSWGQAVTYAWGQNCPWGTRPDNITYNNPWNMSSEGRFYNFIRSVETSPNFLYSDDAGQTWTFGGRLTASAQQGYNAGYYKYWGNGVDRIDFFATEAHPRDTNTSVYHGYIKGEKSYDSFDQELDDNIYDGNAPGITAFTRVFGAGQAASGVTLHRLWNFDIARYDDGTIGVLWQGRETECPHEQKDTCEPNHHLAYSRFNGTEWKSTRLVKGGRTLYRNRSEWWEEDYLGGGALDPDDPHVIYVSTPIDPRDDSTDLGNHEIWKGVTCDDGASFQWTPMTMNSPNENLRPAVPKWDANNTALLWFRGSYQTAQMYSAEVVGILTREE